MDAEALQGLIRAYDAAPSADLARVIALELARADNIADSIPWLEPAAAALSGDERQLLGGALIEAGETAAASALLDTESPAEAVLKARALLAEDAVDEARALYAQAIDADPGVQDEGLNAALGRGAAAEDRRRRMRVIEKPDMAEVVNLDRFRAETNDFSDVVGLEKIKKQIHKKIIMPFQKPSLFSRFRKKIGGGVLLFGPPGCGKTLLARATAGECKAAFFNIEISDVLDMYIGESERKLHAIFENARQEAPSVLFFDEIEALAGKREHARNSSASNVISQMLTELDGFSQANSGVLVLASTNVPWAIDPAFLRPGRFDRMFFVPPPDQAARAGILEHHMRERPDAGDIDYALLAKKTAGYSGADLANLVEMAADEAIDASIESEREVPIAFAHFREALAESRSTTVEWLTTARNYARYANDGGRYNEVIDFLKKHGK